MPSVPKRAALCLVVFAALLVAAPAQGATQPVLYVGNNWDGTADVINVQNFARIKRLNIIPDKSERLAEIMGDPVRQGFFLGIRQAVGEGHDQFVDDMFSSKDGGEIYVSRPSFADVVAINVETGKIRWRTKVDGQRADHMAISPDGRRVLVSASTERVVDVIDTASGKIVNRFESGDQPHENNYSADGTKIFHASIGTVYTPTDEPALDATKGDRYFQVVDARNYRILKRVEMGPKMAEAGYPNFSSAVRPMALAPDEKKVYFQLSFFHGFVEYDLERDKVLRVKNLPDYTNGAPRETYLLDSAHHGLSMNPEGTKLCVAGTMSDYAAIVERQSFRHRIVSRGTKPYWSTNSGDGKLCFVSYSGDDAVGVISYREEREIARFKVGDHPQRMRMGVAPGAVTCLGRRFRARRTGLAGVRIGRRRRTVEKSIESPILRKRRRSTRWCVKNSRGHVTAAFTRRQRVGLVLSTARGHGTKGVWAGRRASRLRRAFPRRIRLRRGLYRAGPRSRLLVGTRRGKIAFVAVASRGVLRKTRTTRGYLRLAGVRR
jgi:DNA-binding beta-propeller fold protein YncE